MNELLEIFKQRAFDDIPKVTDYEDRRLAFMKQADYAPNLRRTYKDAYLKELAFYKEQGATENEIASLHSHFSKEARRVVLSVINRSDNNSNHLLNRIPYSVSQLWTHERYLEREAEVLANRVDIKAFTYSPLS